MITYMQIYGTYIQKVIVCVQLSFPVKAVYFSWINKMILRFYCCLVTKLCPFCDSMDCSLTRLLCPWKFFRQEYWSVLPLHLQKIFPTQELNPHLWGSLHWQTVSLPLIPAGKSRNGYKTTSKVHGDSEKHQKGRPLSSVTDISVSENIYHVSYP